MNLVSLILFLLAGAYLTQFLFSDETGPRKISGSLIVWRWVFLCALTALTALLGLQTLLSRRTVFRFTEAANSGGVLGFVYAGTTIFLLIASPFFFRRLRPLAVLAWVAAVLAAFWAVLPVY